MTIDFLPIHSPEYIAHCEATNTGYSLGVSEDRKWIKHKAWCSDDVNDKAHMIFLMKVYVEMFGEAPEPYALTFANGTYKTPDEQIADFFNSCEHGILMPLGLGDKLPPITLEWRNDED